MYKLDPLINALILSVSDPTLHFISVCASNLPFLLRNNEQVGEKEEVERVFGDSFPKGEFGVQISPY